MLSNHGAEDPMSSDMVLTDLIQLETVTLRKALKMIVGARM